MSLHGLGQARTRAQEAAPRQQQCCCAGGTTGSVASVALVRAEDRHVLLTRERRSGKSLLNLPGGKGEAGESLGQTAAREAHEETGKRLTQRTRDAIAAIADWAECGANQGRVGVLRLAAGDPDANVDRRFDRDAANAQRGSATVQEGLEWHPLADVGSDAWRKQHMHFSGQHRAAAAARVLGAGGVSASSAAAGGLNLGNAVQQT